MSGITFSWPTPVKRSLVFVGNDFLRVVSSILFALFLGVVYGSNLRGKTPKSQAARSSPLTEARQVRGLSPAEADQHHPVRLRGVVTCSDYRAMWCFMQDETAGIYLYNPDQPLKAGQFVEVIGSTGSGRYSPIVQVQTVKVLGLVEMPIARNVLIDQLATGSEDSQWIEIQGIVHAQTNGWDHFVLDIVAGANRVKARILDYERGREPELIDAKVRVRGVVGTHYNNKKQLTGFHLLVPDISHLTVQVQESGSARFGLKIDPLASDALDSQAATQLLHIAREAMSNSLKHSQARTTMISLQENSGSIPRKKAHGSI